MTTIAAAIGNAEDSPLCTTLSRAGARVRTVEHLLSALEACGVDNCRIEISGGNEVCFFLLILSFLFFDLCIPCETLIACVLRKIKILFIARCHYEKVIFRFVWNGVSGFIASLFANKQLHVYCVCLVTSKWFIHL